MVRIDGRGLDKIRKVTITRNYIKYPEGSCLIELGNTKVICTASVEETVPPFLRNSGTGWPQDSRPYCGIFLKPFTLEETCPRIKCGTRAIRSLEADYG